jgi:titin
MLFSPDRPLEFLKPLQDQDVMETQTATLTTEVNLAGKTAQWLKNGKAIKASEHYEMISEGTTHTLLIKDAVLDDEAEYTVVIGDAKSTATVFVEGETGGKMLVG